MVDNYNVETLEAVQHYIVKENNFFFLFIANG